MVWGDYKVVLLLMLGSIIVIPLGIPAALMFAEVNLRRLPENSLTPYAEPLVWVLMGFVTLIFLNLTLKLLRGLSKSRKE